MIIQVPYETPDNTTSVLKFDSDSVMITEENISIQASVIAQKYSLWSMVYAQYQRKLLLLEAKHAKWLAQAKQVVMDSTKVKYSSETAKMDAVLNFQNANGVFEFAEQELQYQNQKAELLYYIDILDSAILKSLNMEKDMIITLGAQMRAGYSASTNTVN